MTPFLAILKRELRSIFLSPLAGILGALYLLLSGTLCWFNLLEYQHNNLRIAAHYRSLGEDPVFLDFNTTLIGQDLQALSLISLLFLPLICMNLVADERRSGTLELIMTSPVSEWVFVIAKWCAAQIFLLTLLLAGALSPMMLGLFTPLHWPTLILGLVGIMLMGGAFIALAIFLGSLTRSTLIAGAAGFTLMLMLWLGQGFVQPGATGWGGLLATLSAMTHLEHLLGGLLDSGDVLYFFVLTILGLELSRRSLAYLRGGGR